MNNDLISRSALKANIPELDSYDNGCYVWLKREDVEELIDNAPTVEPTFGLFRAMLCETCQAYATNRAIVRLADEYTKPQGEITNEDIQQAIKEGFSNGYEMAKAKLVKMLKDRIEESVCKYCQMNKHCELCEISRVFSIIALTDKDMKGGAENDT